VKFIFNIDEIDILIIFRCVAARPYRKLISLHCGSPLEKLLITFPNGWLFYRLIAECRQINDS